MSKCGAGIAAANAAVIKGVVALPVATSPINVLRDRFWWEPDAGVERVCAMLTKLDKRVRLKLKRKRFAEVLDRLGLTASRNPTKRTKRKRSTTGR